MASRTKFVDAPVVWNAEDPYVETIEFAHGMVRVKLFYETESRPRKGVVTRTSHQVNFLLDAQSAACIAETLVESVAASRNVVVQAAEARVGRLAHVAVQAQ
jgi:hypothetical protein